MVLFSLQWNTLVFFSVVVLQNAHEDEKCSRKIEESGKNLNNFVFISLSCWFSFEKLYEREILSKHAKKKTYEFTRSNGSVKKCDFQICFQCQFRWDSVLLFMRKSIETNAVSVRDNFLWNNFLFLTEFF